MRIFVVCGIYGFSLNFLGFRGNLMGLEFQGVFDVLILDPMEYQVHKRPNII